MNPTSDFGNGRQADKAFVSSNPEIDDLPVLATNVGHLSCWELAPEELAEVQRTGRIYLHVVGPQHPPVALLTSLEPADEASSEPPE